jgi:hypothetical protein
MVGAVTDIVCPFVYFWGVSSQILTKRIGESQTIFILLYFREKY